MIVLSRLFDGEDIEFARDVMRMEDERLLVLDEFDPELATAWRALVRSVERSIATYFYAGRSSPSVGISPGIAIAPF